MQHAEHTHTHATSTPDTASDELQGKPVVAETGQTGQAGQTERILAIFTAKGLKNTRQRRLIAEHIAECAGKAGDFTAQEFWQNLQRSDGPDIGRATVYRAIDLLVSAGALDSVPLADGSHRYRVCGRAHHHHLTCTECHCIVEVGECLPPEILTLIERQTNFAIEGHSVELFGRCAACQKAHQQTGQ